MSCSEVEPCYDLAFKNVSLASSEGGVQFPPQGTCTFNKVSGVRGLIGAGCS